MYAGRNPYAVLVTATELLVYRLEHSDWETFLWRSKCQIRSLVSDSIASSLVSSVAHPLHPSTTASRHPIQIESGTDHGKMAERLGRVAELFACACNLIEVSIH